MNIQRRVILFNGPPRSGKDACVNTLMKTYPYAMTLKLSAPLKRMVPALFGLNNIQERLIEDRKDEQLAILDNHTFRELQIWLSEECIKPKFGSNIFGKIAAKRIQDSTTNLIFVSDSGFEHEVLPIVNEVGKQNVLLIRLHRNGTSYANDSRSYITIPDVSSIDLPNDGSLRDLEYTINQVVKTWLQA